MNSEVPSPGHIPVMLEETIKALDVRPGGRYIDCTLGGGGHALAILENSTPGGQLLGIDADPEAIRIARERLKDHRSSILVLNDNFVNLQAICIKYDFSPVHGILFDLGLSSLQLSGESRGFSFQNDAPLDMRFGADQKITAADIVNTYSESELSQLIRTYGEESFSRQIAHRIVRERPLSTTIQLAHLVEHAISKKRGKIHPATKTFQALRIAVNRELENLKAALKQAIDLLGFEGKLVVISYHSLEDRITKQIMQQEARDCICPPGIPACVCGHKASLRLISKKVITPSEAEVRLNPRSRSAKMRVAERVTVRNDCFSSSEEPDYLLSNNSTVWRKPSLLKKLKVAFLAS